MPTSKFHPSGLVLKSIVAALGLEGRRVRSITLKASFDAPATVEVVELVDEGRAEGLAEVLRRYELREPGRTLADTRAGAWQT